MNAPEFNQPNRGNQSLKVGDTVSFRDQKGEERVGKVASSSPGGTFEVVANGVTYYRRANEMFPIGGGSSSAVNSLSPEQGPVIRPDDYIVGRNAKGEIVSGRYHHADQNPDAPTTRKLIRTPQGMQAAEPDSIFPYAPSFSQGQDVRFPFAKGNDDYHGTVTKVNDNGTYDVSSGSSGRVRSMTLPAGDIEPREGPAIPDGKSNARFSTANRSTSEMAADHVQAAREKSNLDAVQTVLDGVGVAGDAVLPGAGVAADGINAATSLARAASDPANAGKHLKNAAISTVSMVPFVGDLAKIFKYGGKGAKAAKAAGKAGRAAEDSGVSDRVRRFLAGEDEQTQEGSGGGPPDEPGSHADESSDSGSGDDGDPLTGRSASVKDKVFEFGSVVGKASAATIAAANSVSLLNRAAIEYHRDLVKYNGEIAEAYGKLESERAGRSMRQGQELSGSLSGLVESQSNLEDKLQDFSSPWKVIGADIARILTDILAVGVMIVDFLEPISEIYVNHVRPLLVKWGVFKSGDKVPSTGWFDKIQAEAAANSKKPRKV